MTSAAPFSPLHEQATRSDQVHGVLRRALLSGAFAPGEQLNEGKIAQQLGVSKTPVREALSMLRASGLVVTREPRGLAVAVMDPKAIRDIYELRELLEPEAVRLAVPLADADLVERARSVLREARKLMEERDLPGLSQVNRDFHELLFERCGNDKVKGVLRSVRDQVEFAVAAGWSARPSWEQEAVEHDAILDAVEEGDARLAAKLTKKHIQSACRRLIDAQVDTGADVAAG